MRYRTSRPHESPAGLFFALFHAHDTLNWSVVASAITAPCSSSISSLISSALASSISVIKRSICATKKLCMIFCRNSDNKTCRRCDKRFLDTRRHELCADLLGCRDRGKRADHTGHRSKEPKQRPTLPTVEIATRPLSRNDISIVPDVSMAFCHRLRTMIGSHQTRMKNGRNRAASAFTFFKCTLNSVFAEGIYHSSHQTL